MDYKEQIKHPNWQKKRLKILNRDEFMCQECGETKNTLHVHHLRYLKGKMIWEYEDFLLRTLCDVCHKETHILNDDIKDLICQLNNTDLVDLISILKIISRFNPIEVDSLLSIIKLLGNFKPPKNTIKYEI